jgi:hypothetical protein
MNDNTAVLLEPEIQAPDHSTSRKGKTKLSIQEHFEVFHRDNPYVYELLVSYAWEAKNAGHRRLGIALLFERIRWHLMIETASLTPFKLNNNLRSRYVRMIEENEPSLKGFFRTRGLRSL